MAGEEYFNQGVLKDSNFNRGRFVSNDSIFVQPPYVQPKIPVSEPTITIPKTEYDILVGTYEILATVRRLLSADLISFDNRIDVLRVVVEPADDVDS